MKNKFYEVQQKSQNGWKSVGFCKTKKQANKLCEQFNTGVTVSPMRIVDRDFLLPE
tara:strand:+ start:639 stop:806 length:168 start_codon:yes stop_codon:yes gene_type:complete